MFYDSFAEINYYTNTSYADVCYKILQYYNETLKHK